MSKKRYYTITFTATWSHDVEANSKEEAEKIMDRDWEELSYGIDGSATNLEGGVLSDDDWYEEIIND